MSSIAKKMLERHGGKEGMGLGKNAQGVATYVKVVRRDPYTATGLGHAADATQAPQASTFSVELDAVYSTMTRTGRKRLKGAVTVEEEANAKRSHHVTREKRTRQESVRGCSGSQDGSSSASVSSDGRGGSASDGSSSSSSSDDDDDIDVDITRLKDDELLRRCGGVRLGRAGRHRFFNGKLRRIEKSHLGEQRDGP
ncbi:hypothetical protein TraAM80_09392 [Trypanosoma rangeli]|uniref:G-patch domain-containing protein n=1 Tax=Trypanosoma rangeli TaxID=5698 RepID=A0A3R7R7G3_TRYRA|nr:uncharacterized protein TraAM80_09392 [Trypanosoma rangeli]RNE97301.1 hypothetical protein TraAM80_09392 [Trypanosoma rangeli]|eukprot:RNE97301.1 hypothetical protein TraAM80_09392 [Trypanosoma rangeli]